MSRAHAARRRACGLAVALVALALAPSAPAAPGDERLEAAAILSVESPARARYAHAQAREGEDAARLREALDRFFGDGDGSLAAAEVARAAAAIAADLDGQPFDRVAWNGEHPRVLRARVAIVGAEGDAASPAPLLVEHALDLAGPPREGELRLELSAVARGFVRIAAPPGWSADGSAPPEGLLGPRETLVVVLRAPAADAPAADGPAWAWGAGAAVAATAAWVVGRRRLREGCG